MKKETKELVDEYNIAKDELESEEQRLSGLNARRNNLSGQLNSLQETVGQLNEEKGNLLADFALGAKNEGELSSIREEIRRIGEDASEALEMLSAIDTAIQNTETTLKGKRSLFTLASRRAWRAIGEEVRLQAPPGVDEYLARIQAAELKFEHRISTQVGTPFGVVNVDIPKERMQAAGEDLEKEFIGGKK